MAIIWDRMYIKTSRIKDTVDGKSYIQIPKEKGMYVEVPAKLVRPTRRKTIKNLSYARDFTFRLFDENERYVNISRAEFEKFFADEHVKLVETMAR